MTLCISIWIVYKMYIRKFMLGVHLVAQWVQNPTAAAGVTVEALVQSLAWCSGLKDPAFSQLWWRWQRQPRFLAQELPYTISAAIKKEKNHFKLKKKKPKLYSTSITQKSQIRTM